MEPDEARFDVWHAMSDLYLDEDLTVGAYLQIAERLANTSYSAEELDSIFFDEVHPVFCWNLTVPAGHWGDFGRDWVKEKVIKEIDKKPARGWIEGRKEARRVKEVEELRVLVSCDWEKVKLLVEVIRGRGLREVIKV